MLAWADPGGFRWQAKNGMELMSKREIPKEAVKHCLRLSSRHYDERRAGVR
jgi:hypothetical protein